MKDNLMSKRNGPNLGYEYIWTFLQISQDHGKILLERTIMKKHI